MAIVHSINIISEQDYWATVLGVLRPRLMDQEPLGIGTGEIFSDVFHFILLRI